MRESIFDKILNYNLYLITTPFKELSKEERIDYRRILTRSKRYFKEHHKIPLKQERKNRK